LEQCFPTGPQESYMKRGWKTDPWDSQSCETVKYGHKFHGTQNQELLCWWGPAANYMTDWPDSGPVGPKTKNDCAGEDQQQFTQPSNCPDPEPLSTLGRVPVVGGLNQATHMWMYRRLEIFYMCYSYLQIM
jgi:hypothetical protein